MGAAGVDRVRSTVVDGLTGVRRRAEDRLRVRAERDVLDRLYGPDRDVRYDLQTRAIVHRVLGAAEGSLGVDVGCNRGNVLTQMVAAAPGVRHVAFEADPELHAALLERFPGQIIHRAVFGVRTGGDAESDRAVTLDDALGERTPALVTIDVEGGEVDVMRGAGAMLDRARPVLVFGHGPESVEHDGSGPDDVLDLLQAHGYHVWLFGGWLEHGPALRRDQFRRQYEEATNVRFVAQA